VIPPVRSTMQAVQLGAVIFAGVLAPQAASERLWEKRPLNLQRVKLLDGLSSTVAMTCIVYVLDQRFLLEAVKTTTTHGNTMDGH
ncbi:hypothetical protein BGZ65_011633, partial [Modicella reniformis]